MVVRPSWTWRQQSQTAGTGLNGRKMRGWCECDAGSTTVQETVSTRNLVTWWPPTRCSLASSKKISAKCPELAALVPEISKVARAAVPTPKSTATPAEQREESLQALRKATTKSASAEEAVRKHGKKLEAAKKTLEDLQAQTAELEEKRKEKRRCTTFATPTAQEMDLDETEAQVQEAEAAMARAKEESAAKRRTTNTSECDASARAQAEMEKAIDDASLCSGEKCNPVNRSSAEQKFRILSASISTWARRPRVCCGVPRWDAFRQWHLASVVLQQQPDNRTIRPKVRLVQAWPRDIMWRLPLGVQRSRTCVGALDLIGVHNWRD